MTSDKNQHEPTMEEILASIRQIISEDGDEVPPPIQNQPAAPREIEAEPLDLTQVVNEDGSVTDVHAALATERTAEPELDDIAEAELDWDLAEPEAAAPAYQAPAHEEPAYEEPAYEERDFGSPPQQPPSPEPLVSPERANVVQSALGRLTSHTRVRASADPTTIEGLVTEMLRPMLKEWLDANLPAIVERLVREEIERITRRAG